eukprot:49987-Eustigmatos_ZCMA.PRE.1
MKVNKYPPKNKSVTTKDGRTHLRVAQALCAYRDHRLNSLVTFLEAPLTGLELQWFQSEVMDNQHLRDKRLLEALRDDKRPLTHTALERVHRKCVKDDDGNINCQFGSLKDCRHMHCPHPITGALKDKATRERDVLKVHAHSKQSQSTSIQGYYTTW